MTTSSATWAQDWLLGSHGLYRSEDGSSWEEIGDTGYPVQDLIRHRHRLLCATLWGLWEVRAPDMRWIQRHDETLTEVNAIAPCAGEPGVAAVSSYGLSFGEPAAHGATRWQSRSEGLSLNERFSNALLAVPGTTGQWLVGTEQGVLLYDESADHWERTELVGPPCRVLLQAHGGLWAGTDGQGVWRSDDGLRWRRAGTGLEGESVFALSGDDEHILVGTLRGICSGDGVGAWRRSGPSLLVKTIAAHPDGSPWLAGANPGGLWRSDDEGRSWSQVGQFHVVHTIKPPETTP